MSRRYVIGIDGGATRTRALLVAPDGEVLGYGEAGPANANNRPLASVVAAIVEAARMAGANPLSSAPAAEICFVGCAGVRSASDGALLEAALADAGIAVRCSVGNDTEAALAGGLEGRPGAVLIAGTGSFCLGRDRTGRKATCGGWGWLLDDVGSGFFLGREAVRAVVLAADGRGPATCLSDTIAHHYAAADADSLLARVYAAAQPEQIARLAPEVMAAAATGDAVATSILARGAAGLAILVEQVARRLTLDSVPVVLVGGVVSEDTPYRALVAKAVRKAVPTATIVPPAFPPVVGAAMRALELMNSTVNLAALNAGWKRVTAPN